MLVIDVTRVAMSIHDDIQQGRPGTNTIRTSSQVVGGWTGAMAGASGGAEIGAGIEGVHSSWDGSWWVCRWSSGGLLVVVYSVQKLEARWEIKLLMVKINIDEC